MEEGEGLVECEGLVVCEVLVVCKGLVVCEGLVGVLTSSTLRNTLPKKKIWQIFLYLCCLSHF